MREKDVFSEALLSQPPLVARLIDCARQARREFSENPTQYLKWALTGEGIGGHLRMDRLRFGLALALTVYIILAGTTFVLWLTRIKNRTQPHESSVQWIKGPGHPPEPPKSPIVDEEPGGGGGGRLDLRPATGGRLPEYSIDSPVIAPTTRIQMQPPSLPIPETLLIDPRLQPARLDLVPTGSPIGPQGPASDGPGSNGGIGTGNSGGIGPGDGPGYGPGKNGGIGGGPGGSGGRHPATDSIQLSARPVALNHPRPNYTEQARIQRIQGVVKARVLVGSDGSVKSVKVTNGLPDGLDDEAIRAAYQMRFRPAIGNGKPVEAWVTLEIEFNLR